MVVCPFMSNNHAIPAYRTANDAAFPVENGEPRRKPLDCTPSRNGPSRASIREEEYEGDFHVHDAIRSVACIVAAGIFRVPRCRWADSPFADNRRHFFGHALLQGP
jgi:hypothetical protein